MSTANKRKGSQWETDLVKYFRSKGHKATRLARTGRNDEGDVELETGTYVFVVEAKNAARIDLAGWTKEAAIEAVNWDKHRDYGHAEAIPVVVVKRRNSRTSKAYVVMELENWLQIAT
mgnify:CR=1 FL=1